MLGYTVIGFADPPQVIDCSVTHIPNQSSQPVQIVAAMPGKSDAVHVIDATGRYIGIYAGSPGSEQIRGIVGGGSSCMFPVTLNVGERVSLRSMDATMISTGSLCLQFLSR